MMDNADKYPYAFYDIRKYFEQTSEYFPSLSGFVRENIDLVVRSPPKGTDFNSLDGAWKKRFRTTAEILNVKEINVDTPDWNNIIEMRHEERITAQRRGKTYVMYENENEIIGNQLTKNQEKRLASHQQDEELNETKLQMAISDPKYVVDKSKEATTHSDLIEERRYQILEDELKSKRKEATHENTSTQPTKKQKQSDIEPGIGDEGFEDAVEIKVIKKNKINELFKDMKNRNIYMLCEPFRSLSKADAEDLFEVVIRDTTVKLDIPEDIKEYLRNLLSESIESALSEVEKPLSRDTQPLLLWTREVCRHFILYYYYNGLQIDGDEKTWSNQTVYRIIDLFSMFFGELTSGIAFGEIVNEAHKDRVYNVNVNQKPTSSRRGDRNDAVLYQDQTATIIYEQSFGPTEFDMTHYLEDITKLARNGIDDLNYHFIQYGNSSITTAKKLKSISIHGYKYYISIYLTDLVRIKTYRIYEIFKCRIPTSYTDRWLLVKVANIGVYLEALLKERRYVKGKMGEEDMINEKGSDCVHDWISIPDNTPERKIQKK